MIDISKFDQGVLSRYQLCFLTQNQTARRVVERLNPSMPSSNFDFEQVVASRGLHQARFQQAMESEKHYEYSELTNIPLFIKHHLNEVINQIKYQAPWTGDWNRWKGLKFPQMVKNIYQAPDNLYDRVGAAILLAEGELDPTKELRRYFNEWKVRYRQALKALEAKADGFREKSTASRKHLSPYSEALDSFGAELTKELHKVIEVLTPPSKYQRALQS